MKARNQEESSRTASTPPPAPFNRAHMDERVPVRRDDLDSYSADGDTDANSSIETRADAGPIGGAMAARDGQMGQMSEESIAERAYQLYQGRGEEHGDQLADWFEAERQLRQEEEDEDRLRRD